MPERLRRVPLSVCVVCKKSDPPPNRVAIGGLDVWLHTGTECEVEFSARLDRGGGPDVPQPTLAEPPAQTNGGAAEKQPDAVADVPAQAEPRPPADHYAPGGLMDHVAGVIEEQLRDHEARMAAAKAAKQEADQRATVAAQPQASLVLEAIVPDVVVPAQKPMLPGDRRRAEILARNREAQQRFDAEIKERLR